MGVFLTHLNVLLTYLQKIGPKPNIELFLMRKMSQRKSYLGHEISTVPFAKSSLLMVNKI